MNGKSVVKLVGMAAVVAVSFAVIVGSIHAVKVFSELSDPDKYVDCNSDGEIDAVVHNYESKEYGSDAARDSCLEVGFAPDNVTTYDDANFESAEQAGDAA